MRLTILFLLGFVLTTSVGQPCNIPVFRYALERWRPDNTDLIVFHDGPLTPSDEARLQALLNGTQADRSVEAEAARTNLSVVKVDVNQPVDAVYSGVWDSIREQAGTVRPYLVLRCQLGQNRLLNVWHGSLNDAEVQNLTDSPVRQEIVRRLLAGDAVVWLMLRSSHEDRNKAMKELLRKQFVELESTLELPDGIGLPGSELLSDVPLLLRFHIVELDADDPRERFLVHLLTGFYPEALKEDQPLVAPIFGRGRMLEVIPATRLDSDLVRDLTRFLCGACSCQVKEQNPGFDLLIRTNWHRELYGDSIPDPADSNQPPPGMQKQQATQIPIPPGRSRQR
ncbi:MAG: hypothetical protein KDA96_07685 [Planctomycetaceae bacterium]|nr:hypothetical protein [Planctomycetaceae bacterium]